MIKKIVFLGCGLLLTGCTTLHTAAGKGNVKAIERLVKEEANIDETDSAGKTPLIYAVVLNQKESITALLKAGADVNTQADDGNTALHEAVLQGNSTFVALLLEKGADRTIRNKNGKSALDIAKVKGNQSLIDMLSVHEVMVVKENPAPTKAITDSKEPLKCSVDTIEPIPVIVQQPPIIQPVEAEPKQASADHKKIPSISNEEASLRLRKMIAGRETMGIRSFLNQYPHALELIDDPMQRIRYVGPSGLRVIDIIENLGRGTLKESEVIERILHTHLPYKNFSSDELKMLNRYGISNAITDAMVNVSK